MNSLFSSGSGLLKSALDYSNKGLSRILAEAASCGQVRYASKKASGGGNKNPTQAPGKGRGIKRWDGTHVYPGEIIVFRPSRMWFHPGLNVCITRRRMNLVALKEGTVRVSSEKPDLNFNNGYVKMWYSGKEGQVFFKKYFHVIPKPQHTRFKCIDQI